MSVRRQRGLTLVELLVTTMISLLIFAGLNGVVRTALNSRASLEARVELMRQANFAMDRMTRATANSRHLLLPLRDRASTNWPEHIREQTIPASPPIGDSIFATAVLAVTLPSYSDLDFDGFPDADNDRDGRIDEDPGADNNADVADGIYFIDDDGDGFFDESNDNDDDEFNLFSDEDPLNGIDDDGDGSIDEDLPADANADGCAGRCGIDDDDDGSIDEGAADDDDEDGLSNEDWYDAVVFYLDGGGILRERTPVPWDETGAGGITGRDYLLSEIAENVTRFRIERLAVAGNGSQLIDITLELTNADGQTASLQHRVRLGGAL